MISLCFSLTLSGSVGEQIDNASFSVPSGDALHQHIPRHCRILLQFGAGKHVARIVHRSRQTKSVVVNRRQRRGRAQRNREIERILRHPFFCSSSRQSPFSRPKVRECRFRFSQSLCSRCQAFGAVQESEQKQDWRSTSVSSAAAPTSSSTLPFSSNAAPRLSLERKPLLLQRSEFLRPMIVLCAPLFPVKLLLSSFIWLQSLMCSNFKVLCST